jgi:hypothetical protein
MGAAVGDVVASVTAPVKRRAPVLRVAEVGVGPAREPVTSPAAAASSMLAGRAPACTRTSITSVIPNTAACSNALPPGTPPASAAARASMSAPASISARATAVEHLPAQHLDPQPRPAREAVLTGHGELRRRGHQPLRDRQDAPHGIRVARLGGAQQILGLAT